MQEAQVAGVKPTVDFVFKKVFGSPENIPVLIGLLNSIVKLAHPIVHVEILIVREDPNTPTASRRRADFHRKSARTHDRRTVYHAGGLAAASAVARALPDLGDLITAAW
ncbi:MAG: Rpn family recombination-promoting nuclease/putative transposase [Pirellulaceae bacterium]|nr:Rpn family recombination-promoting nuclease/putative transposase [Pirellulaceae bacterium]